MITALLAVESLQVVVLVAVLVYVIRAFRGVALLNREVESQMDLMEEEPGAAQTRAEPLSLAVSAIHSSEPKEPEPPPEGSARARFQSNRI